MKKIFTAFVLSVVILWGAITTCLAQTTLTPGDIVIVAINGDVDATNNYGRGFSFMPLVNLEAGTVINFTDYGWSDVGGSFITNTSIIYANEADVLNVALFGITAKQWRDANPDIKGNIRDYATINGLICLSNMENKKSLDINAVR